jgi:hypothetical protein
LPVSKALQKALKGEQDRFKKAMDRAKKLEKKENKWRDEAVKRVCVRKMAGRMALAKNANGPCFVWRPYGVL